jgi:glycosyltransferase involved in cell wall biosynthesis
VQRAAKFARSLFDYGYQPVVVTGPGKSEDFWAPEDATLGSDMRPDVEVHRVPGPEPAPASGWRRRADRMLDLTPRAASWWVEGAIDVGRIAGRDCDVILGELVPYHTARAAAQLSRELSLPWVADLQDPWALDEMWLYPSALHRLRDTARMRRILGTATEIVMNTPEAAARVRRRFPELSERVAEAIPNGFDPADFEGIPPAPKDPDVFRIVHSGYLHTADGFRNRRTARMRRLLGGAPVPGIDILARSHVYLLEAIDRLIALEPELVSKLEVHFAGVLSETDRAVAAASPVARTPGYLSHPATIGLLLSADLLFLPMHDLPDGVRAGLVPGKTYEYLGSGRPILAAVPDGDARDLLGEAGNAFLCGPRDVAGMTEILTTRIAEWRRAVKPRPPQSNLVARYERHRQTEQLANLLDRVLVSQGQAEIETVALSGIQAHS